MPSSYTWYMKCLQILEPGKNLARVEIYKPTLNARKSRNPSRIANCRVHRKRAVLRNAGLRHADQRAWPTITCRQEACLLYAYTYKRQTVINLTGVKEVGQMSSVVKANLAQIERLLLLSSFCDNERTNERTKNDRARVLAPAPA